MMDYDDFIQMEPNEIVNYRCGWFVTGSGSVDFSINHKTRHLRNTILLSHGDIL